MLRTDPPALSPARRRGLHIVAVAGSLRRHSYNRSLLAEAARVAPPAMHIEVYGDLDTVPLFNEDLETDAAKTTGALDLFRAVSAADGLLIASPEYNQSMTGVLKNAIDWLSRLDGGSALEDLPVAITGVTTGPWGTRLSQAAVRHVLTATGSVVMAGPMLFVNNAASKFDARGRLTDGSSRSDLTAFIASFESWITRSLAMR